MWVATLPTISLMDCFAYRLASWTSWSEVLSFMCYLSDLELPKYVTCSGCTDLACSANAGFSAILWESCTDGALMSAQSDWRLVSVCWGMIRRQRGGVFLSLRRFGIVSCARHSWGRVWASHPFSLNEPAPSSPTPSQSPAKYATSTYEYSQHLATTDSSHLSTSHTNITLPSFPQPDPLRPFQGCCND